MKKIYVITIYYLLFCISVIILLSSNMVGQLLHTFLPDQNLGGLDKNLLLVDKNLQNISESNIIIVGSSYAADLGDEKFCNISIRGSSNSECILRNTLTEVKEAEMVLYIITPLDAIVSDGNPLLEAVAYPTFKRRLHLIRVVIGSSKPFLTMSDFKDEENRHDYLTLRQRRKYKSAEFDFDKFKRIYDDFPNIVFVLHPHSGFDHDDVSKVVYSMVSYFKNSDLPFIDLTKLLDDTYFTDLFHLTNNGKKLMIKHITKRLRGAKS